MESRDRVGKILLVTLVLVLAFVAWKRTSSTPSAVTSVEEKSEGKSLVVKDDLERIVKEFILNNPEVIIESIEKMHKRKMDEMSAKVNEVIKQKKGEIEGDKSFPVVGSGNSVVVMFYDPNCGYCKKANSTIEELLDSDKNVKVFYKPLPILGESSEYTTKVLLSVFKLFPDKFRTVNNAIMSQKISSREDIVAILEKNNISVTSIEGEFDNQEIKDSQQKLAVFAGELKIQGVPAFIINDTLYPGLLELDRIKALLVEGGAVEPQAEKAVAPEAAAPKKEG